MPILRFNLVLLGLALLGNGCSSTDEPAAKEAVVAAQPVKTAAATVAPPKSPAKPAAAPELANSKVTTAEKPNYNPPFPERADLFEPSKRAEKSARRGDEQGESVELKGFINVDQPQVVLSIDGVVSPVPEGGEKYGVQVIRIQPPSVDLRRNGRNWRATLE
jgi:hypothetical protein